MVESLALLGEQNSCPNQCCYLGIALITFESFGGNRGL